MKTNQDVIPGVDDAYLDSVKKWQDKKVLEVQKRKSGLNSCKTCRKEVAKTAKVCPHCGAELRWGFSKKLIAFIIIAPVAFGIVGQLSGPYVPKHDLAEAQVVVRHAITSRLKDPDSYKELQSKVAVENGNKLIFVEYTATNSFNARVRGAAIGIVDANGKLISFTPDK